MIPALPKWHYRSYRRKMPPPASKELTAHVTTARFGYGTPENNRNHTGIQGARRCDLAAEHQAYRTGQAKPG
jgi:hypothetical protein